MESMSLAQGLTITVVAMGVVLVVLVGLWLLVELMHKLVGEKTESQQATNAITKTDVSNEDHSSPLVKDEVFAHVAAITSLIKAHETNPAKKYEIVNVERIK